MTDLFPVVALGGEFVILNVLGQHSRCNGPGELARYVFVGLVTMVAVALPVLLAVLPFMSPGMADDAAVLVGALAVIPALLLAKSVAVPQAAARWWRIADIFADYPNNEHGVTVLGATILCCTNRILLDLVNAKFAA